MAPVARDGRVSALERERRVAIVIEPGGGPERVHAMTALACAVDELPAVWGLVAGFAATLRRREQQARGRPPRQHQGRRGPRVLHLAVAAHARNSGVGTFQRELVAFMRGDVDRGRPEGPQPVALAALGVAPVVRVDMAGRALDFLQLERDPSLADHCDAGQWRQASAVGPVAGAALDLRVSPLEAEPQVRVGGYREGTGRPAGHAMARAASAAVGPTRQLAPVVIPVAV